MMTFSQWRAKHCNEVAMFPDFDKKTLKASDRTKPYFVLVHQKTGQIFKFGPQSHAPGTNDIHYFKTRDDAERHRYSLASRMNDYFVRRETAQLFTDTGEHPDEVVFNPELNDYPNVVDFT